ncbi:hypothetical protein [Limnoglobus roseus]|uniref:Uncharacterized protein n=1 Tax=Limnoglobus roseus TaxID=2598579 RepID=A0A5C1AG11_9BACT|nr:hypothetical protein [Limnoglobus roseus]QEL17173.1 hypothetical protein PX52LOC_04155 [Limnoglobus roseus]
MFTAVFLSAVVLAAPVPKATTPVGPPPKLIYILPAGRTGQVLLTIQTLKRHTEKFTTQRTENGVQIKETATHEVDGPVLSGATLEKSGMTFKTPDDKPLTPAVVNDRLKAAGGVLIAPAEGDEVDPVYLKLLSADAIVVGYKNEGVAEKKTIYVNPIIRFEKSVIVMPTLVSLKADDKGVVHVPAMGKRVETVKFPVTKKAENGDIVADYQERKRTVMAFVPTPFDDVKPEVMTADGKPVTADVAKKQLAAGTTVVVSGDGKPLDEKFHKLFKPDTIVLVSEKMATPTQQGLIGGIPYYPPGTLPAVPAK